MHSAKVQCQLNLQRTIQLLTERFSATAAELAAELNVSERSIHRYIDILRDAGACIAGSPGHGGGFILRQKENSPLHVIDERVDKGSAGSAPLSGRYPRTEEPGTPPQTKDQHHDFR